MSTTDFNNLTLQQKELLGILANYNEAKFKQLCGVRNYDKSKRILNYDLSIKNVKGLIVELTLKVNGSYFNIEIDFSENQRRSKCSCLDIPSYSRRKRCEHIAIAINHLKKHPELIIDESKKDSKTPTLSKEEISQIQAEAQERRKHIENLNLDPDITMNVLGDVKKVITALLLQGLQRLSHSTIEWLNDLIIQTQIAKLANINKELKKISELIRNYLDKSVLFDMNLYKYRINQLSNYYLLCEMLVKGKSINYSGITPDIIIGKFRSSYIPAEDITAQCTGMSAWKSKDNNFIGITGYYLNLNEEKLFSISNVLPTMYFGTDPLRIYRTPLKTLGLSMYQLAHGCFKFTNVKFNNKGNLSLHKELKIYTTPFKDIYTSEEFQNYKIKNWLKLITIICNFEAVPIRLPFELNNFFILNPASWGKFDFDPITQQYSASLVDEDDNVIILHVVNEPHNKLIISNLQTIYKNQELMPNSLLGSIFVKNGYVSINPITVFWYQGIKLRESTTSIRNEKDFITEFHLNLEHAKNLSLN